ncbi:membrane protein [[Actinobacillus] muris]|uniref:Membrane protein n=1 Tax=Muribacter muris TaxID=67855 RepID=A0A0J5P822_9PAST|nr:DUF997 family protein [Muribacter muris]KMK51915.1 membrane protein [[Actinobacillus] muris] [Muribacter muris]
MKHSQIHREVIWTLWLTLFYVIGWVGCAYFSPNGQGWLGFPLWFELACVYLPLVFILLVSLVIKTIFQEIELEGDE